ncbi:hypothetical protein IMZ31_19615 (plasmid) [Pontibacillus sp. ALD_SL1]|nr:hypothetical protein IMZ31_19615 [Pontibacillus sp. ALD_SL1]
MIDQKKIIFCSEKHRIRGDVLIDDKPQTFLAHRALGMECLLVDQPYNRHIDTSYRYHSLLEAEDRICKSFL